MKRNISPLLLFTWTVLFGTLFLGYVLGNGGAASQTSQARPKVVAIGTELLDRPMGPNGVPFNLTSIFAFTSDFFHCVVVTNDQPFTMPTHSMGAAAIGKNQFFMSVDSVSIQSAKRQGAGRVELKGTARSITRVGDKYEEAIVPFTAAAVDGGPGHEKDSLVLTVVYDEKSSPMQLAIFGPEARFGQSILSGDITIAPDRPVVATKRGNARGAKGAGHHH